jgi:hypothetical protein
MVYKLSEPFRSDGLFLLHAVFPITFGNISGFKCLKTPRFITEKDIKTKEEQKRNLFGRVV